MKDFIVSIYPLKDKKFLASYVHPLSKKRIREHFDSRESANEFRQKVEAKFKRSNPDNYLELTIEELLVLFMQDHPKSDFAKAKMHLIDFVETFGGYQLEDITTDTLKAWLDQDQRENNLRQITMRGLKCSIDAFFKYLIENEIISESPLTTVFYQKIVPEIGARNILSKRQIEDLLGSAKTYSPGYLYPMVRLFAETAARPSEVIELNWRQMDPAKNEIHFPKTDFSHERTLKISEELTAMFAKKKKTTGSVFMTYYNEAFTKNKLARLIIEFKVMSGCKIKWTPMDLRHSFAVNFLKAGGDMKRLQYLLGHHSVYDTRRLYADVLKDHAQKEATSPFEIGS
jgi:integrase/recombinase XerD